MNSDDASNIIIEAVEVFINHILYVREIYPLQIFKKRRVYNTPIYVSIYPPLNNYLYKVLRTAQELKRNNELQQVDLLFYRDEMVTYERYVFNISEQTLKTNENDEFLLDFEEQLRSALYMLSERAKALEKLPENTNFKVLLHTTQAGFVRLSHNPNYQDFPWLHESLRNEPDKKEIEILPLSNVASVGLEIVAEVL